MSLTRTVVLEASSHTNQKTVFRIPSKGKLILSQLRLVNFGIESLSHRDGNENFAWGSGVYSLISAVRLYSGNILLDEIKDAHRYLSLANLTGTTNYNWDVRNKTLCSSVNVETELLLDDLNKLELKPKANKLLGLVNLSDFLAICESTPAFWDWPDMRVEVEYNTKKEFVLSSDGQGRRPGLTWTVSQPTMLYTEEMDEMTVKQTAAALSKNGATSLVFNCYEREYLASVPDTVQSSLRLRGFDNKYLDSLVVQVIDPAYDLPENQSTNKLCQGRSDMVDSLKFNWMLNGSRMLPFNGFDTAARQAASMADYTVQMVVPFNAWDQLVPGDNVVEEFISKEVNLLSGHMHWTSVDVKALVNRLDIDIFHNSANGPVEMWVWGYVTKFVTKDSKGNIVVGYYGDSLMKK
jgi:hypothetical protein